MQSELEYLCGLLVYSDLKPSPMFVDVSSDYKHKLYGEDCPCFNIYYTY